MRVFHIFVCDPKKTCSDVDHRVRPDGGVAEDRSDEFSTFDVDRYGRSRMAGVVTGPASVCGLATFGRVQTGTGAVAACR